MAIWSKLDPRVSVFQCHELAHPWSENCFWASANLYLASSASSAGFFLIMYLCEYLSKFLKKRKTPSFKEFLKAHVRSTTFGALITTITLISSCIIRKSLGKFYYFTTILVPATIGGCAIFIENRKSTEMFTNAFANCALELFMRQLEDLKILKWNSNQQTFVFMILSSLLSSLLSTVHIEQQMFWFYLPPKVDKKSENEVCFHKDTCQKHNFNLFLKYSITGFILQNVRLLLNNLNHPTLFISSLLNIRSFKLAGLLGGYVFIYQAVRCFLFQKEKKYSPMHDTLAGFLAGSTFRFQPTIPVFNTAVISLFQIFTEMAYKRKMLPSLPYLEIVFAMCSGILFHTRMFFPEKCPRLLNYFMSAITGKRSDVVANNYQIILKHLNL